MMMKYTKNVDRLEPYLSILSGFVFICLAVSVMLTPLIFFPFDVFLLVEFIVIIIIQYYVVFHIKNYNEIVGP